MLLVIIHIMKGTLFFLIVLTFYCNYIFPKEPNSFNENDIINSILKINDSPVENTPNLKSPYNNSLFDLKDDAILVNDIKSIVLVDSPQKIIKENFGKYSGVVFIDLIMPGQKEVFKKYLEKYFVHKALTKNKINEIQNAIICYYKDQNRPLVIVYPPNQKISSGVLQFVVIESNLGEIRFLKNRWFSSKLLKKYIHLKENKPIDSNVLAKDLISINRNPFRNTIVLLKPGKEDKTTDIEFITKDRIPYRLLLGYDNTGYKTTGEQRLFTGIDLANLFNLDQILSYQYIVSTDFGKFYAHTAKYLIPMTWGHQLEFFGGYSGISALMPIKKTTSKGNSWQTSFRYTIPLKQKGTYTHECKIGFDYKKTDVNLIYDAIPILGNQTLISQIMFGYNSSFQNPIADTSINLQWYISPGEIFSDQSKKDYNSLGSNARSSYTYLRANIIPIFHLPSNYELIFKTEFQCSTQSLLSSEQLGLGGYNTVRGYDERTLNTDNGLLLSSEIRTPKLRPLTKNNNSKYTENLQFLIFLDYGFGFNHKALTYLDKNFYYLIGTGFGLRYFYNSYVNVRLDWGYPLHHKIAENIKKNKSKTNFSLIFSF